MNIWQFPIVRITIWFVFGVLISHYFAISNKIIAILFTVSFFGLILLSRIKIVSKKVNYFFGFFLFLNFFLIGIAINNYHNQKENRLHFSKSKHFNNGNKQLIQLEIEEKLKTSENYNRYFAIVYQINKQKAYGKVLLQIKKDFTTENLIAGTNLLVFSEINSPFKNKNPNQFDYADYLKNKNCYGQIFISKTDLKIASNLHKNLHFYISKFRNTIFENIKKSGFNSDELALIMALILGQQQDISKELSKEYQYAGAVHILSVSGLHVGFIMLFLSFLLKPLPNNSKNNIIKLFLILLGLWSFGLVAGMAPSALRSVCMFSFLAIGQFLNRPTSMYHSLLVSIFCILLFEPNFLFDIGFQLSYLALFFILWLQPELKKLWNPKNKIVIYFWDILTVSFAAQIGTLPLSLYYFHQFPGLFFITNLLVLPLVSVIMGIGLLVCILAYFSNLPLFLVKIMSICVSLMNFIISKIASFDTFVLQNIPLSFNLMFILYLIFLFGIFWYKKPKYLHLVTTLICVILFQILFLLETKYYNTDSEIIVFNTKNNLIIGEKNNKNIVFNYLDEIDSTSYDFQAIQNYTTSNFLISNWKPIQKNVFSINKKRILIVDKFGVLPLKAKPNILLITESPKLNLDRVFETINPEIVIFACNNYKSYVSLWKSSCIKHKIPFHSVYEKGFYLIK